jgi:hypothetical protein
MTAAIAPPLVKIAGYTGQDIHELPYVEGWTVRQYAAAAGIEIPATARLVVGGESASADTVVPSGVTDPESGVTAMTAVALLPKISLG